MTDNEIAGHKPRLFLYQRLDKIAICVIYNIAQGGMYG